LSVYDVVDDIYLLFFILKTRFVSYPIPSFFF
jgi:hypothetical protein